MYESQFNQFHGWYTAQAMARSGFMKHQRGHAPSAPAELVQLRLKAEPTMIVEPPPGVVLAPGQSLEQWLYQHQSELVPEPAARRSWNRMFQDEARVEFGYRKMGDGFVAETQLASLIREILGPDTTLERHHRPPWLEGLELDIWLPTLAIGIEYQGQQHYKAVSAWGGEMALRDLQARDARKRELCSKHGVALIEIANTERLTRRQSVPAWLNTCKVVPNPRSSTTRTESSALLTRRKAATPDGEDRGSGSGNSADEFPRRGRSH